MRAGVETSAVRLGKLLRRLQPHQRPARWLERGRSASLGHSGRGITCSHAPRGGKPPLERLLACSSLPVSPVCAGKEAADLWTSGQRQRGCGRDPRLIAAEPPFHTAAVADACCTSTHTGKHALTDVTRHCRQLVPLH